MDYQFVTYCVEKSEPRQKKPVRLPLPCGQEIYTILIGHDFTRIWKISALYLAFCHGFIETASIVGRFCSDVKLGLE